MQNILEKFIQQFEKGEITVAIREVLPAPEFAYLQTPEKSILYNCLVNYVDASIFGSHKDAYITNHVLQNVLREDNKEKYVKVLSRLNFEAALLSISIKETVADRIGLHRSFQQFLLSEENMQLLHDSEVADLTSMVVENFRGQFSKQVNLSQNLIIFKKKKIEFSKVFADRFLFSRPWYVFSYFFSLPSIQYSSAKIPVLFLEPVETNWLSVLSPLANRSSIFVFQSYAHFCQLLQFSDVLESICDPKHLIYILDIHPHEQFIAQDLSAFTEKEFSLQPILLTKEKYLEMNLQALTESLSTCLKQSKDQFLTDTMPGNWLYTVAKHLHLAVVQARLGIDRAPALMEFFSIRDSYDRHKGLPPFDRNLGVEPFDLMAEKLEQLKKERKPRLKKIKVAHVISQIIDNRHAPSILLENLMKFCDRDIFEPVVVCTDRFGAYFLEYPLSPLYSPDSEFRGKNLVAALREAGIQVIIQNNFISYENKAREVALTLSHLCVDVVVFHGPDVINLMATNLCNVPLKIFFEHGNPLKHAGFDLAILSATESLEIYRDQMIKIKTEVVSLPYQVDVKKTWLEKPYEKSVFGLPESALIMTTISNHLADRLSLEMCEAIVKILKQVPNAYYMPIGECERVEAVLEYFKEQGVSERVKFLGNVISPSQYARSATLYLNEFPFGSGVSILDALASGCPIVSMYDLKGPPQARFGGVYFGVDKVITSGNVNDYVELACRLLTDVNLHQEWSESAKKQYEKHSDVSHYVKKFETILMDAYKLIPNEISKKVY